MEGCSVCAIGDEREARTAPQHVRVFLRFPTNTNAGLSIDRSEVQIQNYV